jgi:hypothetical protein
MKSCCQWLMLFAIVNTPRNSFYTQEPQPSRQTMTARISIHHIIARIDSYSHITDRSTKIYHDLPYGQYPCLKSNLLTKLTTPDSLFIPATPTTFSLIQSHRLLKVIVYANPSSTQIHRPTKVRRHVYPPHHPLAILPPRTHRRRRRLQVRGITGSRSRQMPRGTGYLPRRRRWERL